MKKIVVIVLSFALLCGLLIWFFTKGDESDKGFISDPYTLPVGDNLPDVSVNSTIVIFGKNNQPIVVKDFRSSPLTVTDPNNPNLYLLYGDLGYCLSRNNCPKIGGDDMLITYSSRDSFFSVLLLVPPFEEKATKAEKFLLDTLGITEEQICSLNISMMVAGWLYDPLAGRELGFNLCPNLKIGGKGIGVLTKSGHVTYVRDFTSDPGVVLVDPKSGKYLLAEEKSFDETIFQIFYEENGGIDVLLQGRDTAFARARAEEILKNILQVDSTELCFIEIYVTVPYPVGGELKERELGLSNCPGFVEI